MRTILIVDDCSDMACLIADVIKTTHPQVKTTHVKSGEHALEMLNNPVEGHPDIVVTDLQMPGMCGCELAKRIRKLHPHLCVVLTSTVEPPEHKAHGFVTKAYLALKAGQGKWLELIFGIYEKHNGGKHVNP